VANQIAVIGAGLMGHGIAQVFAAGGHRVIVQDAVPAALATVHERITANLTRMADYGLVAADAIPAIVGRVTCTADLAEACRGADIVVEAIVENLALKQELFVKLEELCSDKAILCSNTSVISITKIASPAKRRERILGTHFWNPPYLVPLVEVIRTEETDDACMDVIMTLMRDCGKQPVRVNKDVPGFIANRMQHALWREAFAIIDEGICDAETVDVAVRNSFGIRLPVLGPVANADLVGLDLTLAIHDYILPYIDASPTPSATLRRHVEAKELGFKSGSGFQNWTPESIAETRNKLATHLMEMLARQRKA